MKYLSDFRSTILRILILSLILSLFSTSEIEAATWPPTGDVTFARFAETPLGLPSGNNSMTKIIPYIKKQGYDIGLADLGTWVIESSRFPFTISGIKIYRIVLQLHDNGSIATTSYLFDTKDMGIETVGIYARKIMNEILEPDETIEDSNDSGSFLDLFLSISNSLTIKRENRNITAIYRLNSDGDVDLMISVDFPKQETEKTQAINTNGTPVSFGLPDLIKYPMGNIVVEPATVNYRTLRDAVTSKYPETGVKGYINPSFYIKNTNLTLLGKKLNNIYVNLNNYKMFWGYTFLFDTKGEADSFETRLKAELSQAGKDKFSNGKYYQFNNANGTAEVSTLSGYDNLNSHKHQVTLWVHYKRAPYTPPSYTYPLEEITENILTVEEANVETPFMEIMHYFLPHLYDCILRFDESSPYVELAPVNMSKVNMEFFVPAAGSELFIGFEPVYMNYSKDTKTDEIKYEVSLAPVEKDRGTRHQSKKAKETEKMYRHFINEFGRKETGLKKADKSVFSKLKTEGIKECWYIEIGSRTDYYVLEGASKNFVVYSLSRNAE